MTYDTNEIYELGKRDIHAPISTMLKSGVWVSVFFYRTGKNTSGFSSVEFVNNEKDAKMKEIIIGNLGIHIDSICIHYRRWDIKTEEEYFQFSLLNDIGELEYEDYVHMIQFQTRLLEDYPM